MVQQFLLSFLLILSIKCNAQEVFYFRALTGIISPSFEYTGRFPLQESELDDKPFYKFTSDSLGRILSIEYFRRGLPNNGSYFQTASVKYDYKEDQITRSYFNHNNEPTNMWRHYYGNAQIHQENFLLDSSGRKTQLFLLNTEGKKISDGLGHYTFKWSYPEPGQIEQTQYDTNGKLIYLTDFFDYYVTRFHYDYRGYLHRIVNLGLEGQELTNGEKSGTAYVDFFFDLYGHEHHYPHYDSNGNKANRKPYGILYNINSIVGDAVGNISKGERKKLLQRYKNAKGEYVTDQNEIGSIEYINNEFLELIRINYFDINDQPMLNQGYHSMTIDYNANGDRSKIQYLNKEGKLTNSMSGVSSIIFEYDKRRNLIRSKSYNQDNILIKN